MHTSNLLAHMSPGKAEDSLHCCRKLLRRNNALDLSLYSADQGFSQPCLRRVKQSNLQEKDHKPVDFQAEHVKTCSCQLDGLSTAKIKSNMGPLPLPPDSYRPCCGNIPDPYAKACWTIGSVFRKVDSSFARGESFARPETPDRADMDDGRLVCMRAWQSALMLCLPCLTVGKVGGRPHVTLTG